MKTKFSLISKTGAFEPITFQKECDKVEAKKLCDRWTASANRHPKFYTQEVHSDGSVVFRYDDSEVCGDLVLEGYIDEVLNEE